MNNRDKSVDGVDRIPIDMKIINGLIGDDMKLIRLILRKFLDIVPANIDEIRQAFECNEYKVVKSVAHKLKSSANAIGAVHMADICMQIENGSKNIADARCIGLLINELNNEFMLCKKYIDKY